MRILTCLIKCGTQKRVQEVGLNLNTGTKEDLSNMQIKCLVEFVQKTPLKKKEDLTISKINSVLKNLINIILLMEDL